MASGTLTASTENTPIYGPSEPTRLRPPVPAPALAVTIAGSTVTDQVAIDSITIHDTAFGAPDTATFRVWTEPASGASVLIGFGTLVDRHWILFAGRILSVTQVHPGGSLRAWDVQAISAEWLFGRRLVSRRWLSTSPTSIASELCATPFSAGVSGVGIESALPELAEFSVTNEPVPVVLDRLAARAGAAWGLTPDGSGSSILHFGTAIAPYEEPCASVTDGSTVALSGLTWTEDLSQVRTRVFSEGGGSPLAGDIAAAETIVPVDDASWYSVNGGYAKIGTERVTYTGRDLGGGGALVGAFATPTTAPSRTLKGGAGITAGSHYYAVTFYDGTGETTEGPSTSSVTCGVLSAPISDPTPSPYSGTAGSITAGSYYKYSYTYVDSAGGETTACLLPLVLLSIGSGATAIKVEFSTGPDGTAKRKIYRTVYGDWNGTRKLVTTINDNTSTQFIDTIADGSLGASEPTSNTSNVSQVDLASIPIGPTGTTGRKVYRTAAGGSQLKLLTTIANNTSTTYTDSTADGSLGSNVPTSNTSAIVNTTGVVAPGATTMLVTGTAPFQSGGGWAKTGQQAIRYTGISGSTLTGIPAAGAGAITATINYGSAVSALPALTGVSGGFYAEGAAAAVARGEEVTVVAIEQNAAAITAMSTAVGGDGIHEVWISDRRLSLDEASLRALAKLAEVKDPIVTVMFTSRDLSIRSGQTITITRTAEGLSGTFLVQSVRLSGFDPLGQVGPLRRVEATSRRYTFEQILRALRG